MSLVAVEFHCYKEKSWHAWDTRILPRWKMWPCATLRHRKVTELKKGDTTRKTKDRKAKQHYSGPNLSCISQYHSRLLQYKESINATIKVVAVPSTGTMSSTLLRTKLGILSGLIAFSPWTSWWQKEISSSSLLLSERFTCGHRKWIICFLCSALL